MTAFTSEYRANSDKIGNFIAECLEESTENSTIKEVYEEYITWCKDNGFGAENKSNFMAEMKGKGLYAARRTVRGTTCRNIVLRITVAAHDFEPVGKHDKEQPFR